MPARITAVVTSASRGSRRFIEVVTPGPAHLERGLDVAVLYHGHGVGSGRGQSCHSRTSDPPYRCC
jgi:hypothetical protein